MVNRELGNAAVEINEIFQNMSTELLNKIPNDFKEFLGKIANKEYKFEYNKALSLKEQKLLPKTQGILAIIYVLYLCDERDKQDFYKQYCNFLKLKEQQEEKYGANDIFNNKK